MSNFFAGNDVEGSGWYPIEFFVGLDLGQAKNYTAIAVVEGLQCQLFYQIRYLERMRDVSYPKIVDRVYSLLRDSELQREAVHLVVDKTGVGAPVVDLLKEKNLNPIAVTITGGDNPSSVATDKWHREWHVPKRDLISNLVVLSQSQRLKIAADLPEAQTLATELQNMRVKIDLKTAHDSYGAWREGQHDDLVLAAALACWWAENRPPLPYITRPRRV